LEYKTYPLTLLSFVLLVNEIKGLFQRYRYLNVLCVKYRKQGFSPQLFSGFIWTYHTLMSVKRLGQRGTQLYPS